MIQPDFSRQKLMLWCGKQKATGEHGSRKIGGGPFMSFDEEKVGLTVGTDRSGQVHDLVHDRFMT